MAAPRATWKGQIKLSLVTFPVKMFTAVSGANRISFNQLHKSCNRRLKQQMICPEHGPVERADIVKGYEYEDDRYVIIDESDFEKVKLETNHTIELTQFIDATELHPLYHDSAYFVAPDGPLTTVTSAACMSRIVASRRAVSSSPLASIVLVRSPTLMRSAASIALRIGRVIDSVTDQAMNAPDSAATKDTAIITLLAAAVVSAT